MTNFKIDFLISPYLLFLLIPAVALTLYPYFRLSKKYRRNRNRIISLVLHMVIMVLSIFVLSGMTFSYNLTNTENEVILLVDMTYSTQDSMEQKDRFVQSVINSCDSKFKLGVVTFGYNQVYAVPLTDDFGSIYHRYIEAELPDDSATDIGAALNYANTLFHNPETAKVVLITDGVETDGSFTTAIRSLIASGVKVDAAYFGDAHDKPEAQLVDVVLPDYNVSVGDEVSIGITVQSSYSGVASITLYDNGEASDGVSVNLINGLQTFNITHVFDDTGMHEIRFGITSENDNNLENNSYYSYMYLETFDKVLLLERTDGESDELKSILEEDYDITVINTSDANMMPSSLDELRAYDEVVLVNISTKDMPTGFEEILHSYVYDIGGGVFTVGGDRVNEYGETEANAYSRNDLYGTLYQQMLPVQAINYTPPIGVMIIIDKSGSMTQVDESTGKTRLDLAKEGAISCLNALTERDYCGVMTLETDFGTAISITPVTQTARIVAAINAIESGGGTRFTEAIMRAGDELANLNVEKRHIILVSDGMPSDGKNEDDEYEYVAAIKDNYDKYGITFSVVAIGISNPSSAYDNMKAAADAGRGNLYINASAVQDSMRNDLLLPEIRESADEEFQPRINEHTSVVSGIAQEDVPTLSGYYGTKLKEGASATLMGAFVPIYASWKYGAGSVGSFMCDLSATKWSETFMSNETGQTIIKNIVTSLFPIKNIRASDIDVEMINDNYSTNLSVYTDLDDSQKIEVNIENPNGAVQTITRSASEDYSRITFKNVIPGIYKITVNKLDGDGSILSSYTMYKTFSYSMEYDEFLDFEAYAARLSGIVQTNGGEMLTEENPEDAFRSYIEAIHKVYDPRLLFIIIALILFLLDIAVRKFKFKWIHEIVREHKEKKEANKQ